jgi:lipopolysaccharide biosynthesis protein
MAKGGWEKFRYIDTIDDYTKIIEEFQKLYEQTPTTQRYTRARIISGIKQSERELARTQAEYDRFKKYKARTAITK